MFVLLWLDLIDQSIPSKGPGTDTETTWFCLWGSIDGYDFYASALSFNTCSNDGKSRDN